MHGHAAHKRMGIFVYLLVSVLTKISDSCSVTKMTTWNNVTYSLFLGCSLPHNQANAFCNARQLELFWIDTMPELEFIAEEAIEEGFSNEWFWISGICSNVASVIQDDQCLTVKVNDTIEEVHFYIKSTPHCGSSLGWVCEEKQEDEKCPQSTSTKAATTPTTTTITTTTTTTPITTTMPDTTTPLTTPTAECPHVREWNVSSNHYHLLQCAVPPETGEDLCGEYNSSMAVLVSLDEVRHVAQIAGNTGKSHSFWLGGFAQVEGCVLLVIDGSGNGNDVKYRISIGYQCTEHHHIICKVLRIPLKEELRVQGSTSLKGSVMDFRPSAIFLGSLGIAVLVIVIVVVIVIDLPNLVGDVRMAVHNVKKRSFWNTRSGLRADVNKSSPYHVQMSSAATSS